MCFSTCLGNKTWEFMALVLAVMASNSLTRSFLTLKLELALQHGYTNLFMQHQIFTVNLSLSSGARGQADPKNLMNS